MERIIGTILFIDYQRKDPPLDLELHQYVKDGLNLAHNFGRTICLRVEPKEHAVQCQEQAGAEEETDL